jgi:hypothetical protein
MRQYLKNWKAMSEFMEEMNAEDLRALTEEKAAEQFNGMDCDPAWYWTPDERIISSGLIEQQRLFSKLHKRASTPPPSSPSVIPSLSRDNLPPSPFLSIYSVTDYCVRNKLFLAKFGTKK